MDNPTPTRVNISDIDWMIRVHYTDSANSSTGTDVASKGPGTIPTTAGTVAVPGPSAGPASSTSPVSPIFVAIGIVLVLAIAGVALYLAWRRRNVNVPPVPARASWTGASHHDVFISYSHNDKPVADAACAKLEAGKIRCWIAPRDVSPGTDFPEAIMQGIEGSRVMVLIFSSHANASPHVIREITTAVNRGIIIVPFRIEEVALSKTMEYLISVPHWLDAISPPLDHHIDTLVVTVRHILTKTPEEDTT
jgi:hypothetical protein